MVSPPILLLLPLCPQGHIALDQAVFPEGTPGAALDTLARTALWKDGLNYRHGTGEKQGAHITQCPWSPACLPACSYQPTNCSVFQVLSCLMCGTERSGMAVDPQHNITQSAEALCCYLPSPVQVMA